MTEVFAVTPFVTYVTDPVTGRDATTLRTCAETADGWTTIGPRPMSSGPGSGRLIARTDRGSWREIPVSKP